MIKMVNSDDSKAINLGSVRLIRKVGLFLFTVLGVTFVLVDMRDGRPIHSCIAASKKSK